MNVNHIAIVVPDLEEALGFWRDTMGLPLEGIESVPAEGVDTAFLPTDTSNIELIAPTDPESGVAHYLEKRGAGLHHICLGVDDIEAVLDQLRAQDVVLINEEPQTGQDGRRYAFIHPKGTGGVLVELYETG